MTDAPMTPLTMSAESEAKMRRNDAGFASVGAGLIADRRKLLAEVDALRAALAAQREANERLVEAASDALALANGTPRSCGCRTECVHVWDNLQAALATARAATTTTAATGEGVGE